MDILDKSQNVGVEFGAVVELVVKRDSIYGGLSFIMLIKLINLVLLANRFDLRLVLFQNDG